MRILIAAFGHNGPAFAAETERHELSQISAAHLRIASHLFDNVARDLAATLLIVTCQRGINTNDC